MWLKCMFVREEKVAACLYKFKKKNKKNLICFNAYTPFDTL